jgi:hypothetical protein
MAHDSTKASLDPPWTMVDARLRKLDAALTVALGKWTGCDWRTEFGHSRLDLNGMRPSQAHLMALATAGGEAADWQAAVLWLRQVENDAQHAESEALAAVMLARSGKLSEALKSAQRACAIEGRYHHQSLVWQPLCESLVAGQR